MQVRSETGILKRVLIHRPDKGIELVTPDSAVELLYEDIVYLPRMCQEHDEFTTALSYFVGKENVIEVSQLLCEILDRTTVREELLKVISEKENLSVDVLIQLFDLPSSRLAQTLITGFDESTSTKYFNPLPNLIFTRDIGVIINDHLLIGKAAKQARQRESSICQFIFGHHPLFQQYWGQGKLIDLDGHDVFIEGGDIMMLDDGHLVIASSERTTEDALDLLIFQLLENKVVERISRVELPKLRFCMHLDTIFTKFNKNTYVGYEALISGNQAMPVIHYEGKKRSKFKSLHELLKKLNSATEIIPCGEGISPYAQREQWTDACNLFAIKDGVAFTYDRNYRTNRAFQQAGYTLTSAGEMIQAFKENRILPEEVSKTIITISSSELSRARGGPHCMTMPLLRLD